MPLLISEKASRNSALFCTNARSCARSASERASGIEIRVARDPEPAEHKTSEKARGEGIVSIANAGPRPIERRQIGAPSPFHLAGNITGHRAGAILCLTWDRVNMERGRIDFNEPGRELTKKRRTVTPIGPTVIAALRDALQYAETESVIEYMARPVKSVKKAFKKAAADAGVSWASPHVLKHSVISWLSEDGLVIENISELTATDERTVKRIYRKFSPDYLSDAAELLDNLVSLRPIGRKSKPLVLRLGSE